MGLYTAAHVNPQGAGDSRPTALQIVKDQELQDKLVGRTIVITGVTSGIGFEAARALATTGATLLLTVRDRIKAEKSLYEIMDSSRIILIEMDNASVASVRAAASSILEQSNNHINVLIANAGVMGISDHHLTEDGYEAHFATNYLSHFLLFQLLKPALLTSATSTFSSRVVLVASSAHRAGDLADRQDYNFQDGGYRHDLAYANSNLAKVYMANEIGRRYGHLNLHATSLHPGAINTNIGRHVDREFLEAILTDENLVKIFKSPEQGAATTVMAAIGRDWENRGGRYLEDCEEAKRGEDDNNPFGTGYVTHTYNQDIEGRLWKDSLTLFGLKED